MKEITTPCDYCLLKKYCTIGNPIAVFDLVKRCDRKVKRRVQDGNGIQRGRVG